MDVYQTVIYTISRTLIYVFTNSSLRAGCDTRSIFKRSLTGLNSEFSFSQTGCLTKAKESILPYYSFIRGGRIIAFIPFPRVLVQREMQSASSRIWSRVSVSISYDKHLIACCYIDIYKERERQGHIYIDRCICVLSGILTWNSYELLEIINFYPY